MNYSRQTSFLPNAFGVLMLVSFKLSPDTMQQLLDVYTRQPFHGNKNDCYSSTAVLQWICNMHLSHDLNKVYDQFWYETEDCFFGHFEECSANPWCCTKSTKNATLSSKLAFQCIDEPHRFRPTRKTYFMSVIVAWWRHAIWCHKTGSTLAWVMVCCLTAPSRYLNHWWHHQ